MGDFAEYPDGGVAVLDLGLVEVVEALRTKSFDAEAGHDGAEDDGAAEVLVGEVARTVEPSAEAAQEGVAGAGGVEEVEHREGGRGEDAIRREKEGAVFTFFDDEALRTHIADHARSFDEVGFAGELAGLGVVDDEDVDTFEGVEELGFGAFDPEVHGVGHDQAGLVDLVEHASLQGGLDIAEADDIAVAIGVGDDRVESLEDIELGVEGVARVEVVVVATGPEKGLAAVVDLQTGEVDVATAQALEVAFLEVVADDADEAVMLREVAGGQGDVGGGSAEDAIHFTEGGFQAVVGDGSDNEYAHLGYFW